MLEYLKVQLEAGRDLVTVMSVAGNTQVALKMKVEAADSVGIVARVKGMMGGFSEPRLVPWARLATLHWD